MNTISRINFKSTNYNKPISFDEYRNKTKASHDQLILNKNDKAPTKSDKFKKLLANLKQKASTPLGKKILSGLFYTLFFIAIFAIPELASNKKGGILNNSDANNKINWIDLSDKLKIENMALPKELKNILERIKKSLQYNQILSDRGGHPIQSLLLYGPPGTGKTTFAYALAKEFPESELAIINMSQIKSKWHGGTEENITNFTENICRKAKANPNKKIFALFDEVDSVMLNDVGLNSKLSNDELNTFKTCISEKLLRLPNVTIIGTTNIDIDKSKNTLETRQMDEAMLDRFQEKIYVGLPTKEQIKQAIVLHYKDKPLAEESLKTTTSEGLDELCKEIVKRKMSFRELNALFDKEAANIDSSNIEAPVSINNLLNTLKNIQQHSKEQMAIGF